MFYNASGKGQFRPRQMERHPFSRGNFLLGNKKNKTAQSNPTLPVDNRRRIFCARAAAGLVSVGAETLAESLRP